MLIDCWSRPISILEPGHPLLERFPLWNDEIRRKDDFLLASIQKLGEDDNELDRYFRFMAYDPDNHAVALQYLRHAQLLPVPDIDIDVNNLDIVNH
jgi:hypothetical protein